MYFGTACPARASEIQALMVLRARDVLLERNLGIIKRNLEIVERFLQANCDLFSYVRPVAGCVLFVEFKGPLSSTELGAALASQERSKQAVKDETVWVASNVNRQDDALAPATQALCRYSASFFLPS